MQNLKSCSKLFTTEHNAIVQCPFLPLHPDLLLIQRPLGTLLLNATHFTLIQLHKVTPGSCSIQLQCCSAGAGGVKCFCQGHHHRGLPRRETVTHTAPLAQSKVNIFGCKAQKPHSRQNFTSFKAQFHLLGSSFYN